MEYVDGLPVDQFCSARNLNLVDRLKLFRAICQAVHYAHEHSVVHRDIKPSNILVTTEGTPKLLDFGIAKVITHDASFATATGMNAMTPEYASPEQMRGETVGVESDIYSLGVLLYQLVTGTTPYALDTKSPYEIVQAVCEREPIPPSKVFFTRGLGPTRADPANVNASFRHDLDHIILKALRKEPEERYRSVKLFSDDISAWMEGRPVSAGPGNLPYRLAKLVRRQRAPVVIALASFCVLAIALVAFTLLAGNPASALSDPADAPGRNRIGGTANPEAYNYYLRGNHLWSQRSVKTTDESVQMFQIAIDKDPDFALAWSGLSNSLILLSVWDGRSPGVTFSKARIAAEKAIALSPDMSEGHLSRGMIFWLHEWDWEGADREFSKAVSLDPNNTLGHHWYGLFLAEMGRFDEAIASEKRALEMEPLSIPINADLARVYFYARRFHDCAEQYKKAIDLNPTNNSFLAEVLEFYEAAGMTREWHEALKKANLMPPDMERAFKRGGIAGFRRRQRALSAPEDDWDYFVSPVMINLQNADMRDKAFALLNRALDARAHRMVQIKVSPRFDGLRSDPRFEDLLRKMNLH
jgi:tetratricopeptide (TPR) repeat protein